MSTPFEQAGLGGIFAEMQRLQEKLAEAEAASRTSEVEGSAGGGAVRINVSGEFSFNSVTIDASAVVSAVVSARMSSSVTSAMANFLSMRSS